MKAKFYGTLDNKITLLNEEQTNDVISKLKDDEYKITNIVKKKEIKHQDLLLLLQLYNKMQVLNSIIMLKE